MHVYIERGDYPVNSSGHAPKIHIPSVFSLGILKIGLQISAFW